MEEINAQKKLIKLFFYIFFGSIFLFAIKGLFAFMEDDIRYLGDCSEKTSFSKLVFAVFWIKIISKIVFFIGGFYLIKILDFNDLKEIFKSEKIMLFKKSGKLFLASSYIGVLAIIIINIKDGFANLKTNTEFLYSLYFTAIIGLFLLIFSKILVKAKEIQKENELTI